MAIHYNQMGVYPRNARWVSHLKDQSTKLAEKEKKTI